MQRDYYKDLEISRQATQDEICQAYRKLSLRWHPKLCQEDPNTAIHFFNIISEAYEVLSDPIKKAFFDKYGEEKLKNEFFSQGDLKGGYRFKNNPYEIFNNFYNESNPFSMIYDVEGKEKLGSMFGFAFGGQKFKGVQKVEDLVVEVQCTLSELYNGCSKQIEFIKQVMNYDSKTTRKIQAQKLISILPGYSSQTQLRFEKEGNQAPDQDPSDLVIKIVELPDQQFKRVNNDLIYISKINLIEALSCIPVTVFTLNGRELQIPIDKIIQPSKEVQKIVKGEGFPILENEEQQPVVLEQKQKYGDLKIKFEVEFPQTISEKQKIELKQNFE